MESKKFRTQKGHIFYHNNKKPQLYQPEKVDTNFF